MNAPAVLYESSLSHLTLRARGKVRDIYDVDDKHMLIVTTDRLSAFDVILPDPIPGKGRVLTHVSNFWFEKLQHVLPNHLADISLEAVLPNPDERSQVEGRAIVVKKLKPLPVEAIVRGYLFRLERLSADGYGMRNPVAFRLATSPAVAGSHFHAIDQS